MHPRQLAAVLMALLIGLVGLFGHCANGQPPEPMADGKPLSAWLKLLDDADQKNRDAAFVALCRIGKPAVPGLTKALASKNTRLAAAATLLAIGPDARDAMPEVVSALGSPLQLKSQNARLLAAVAIAAILPEDFAKDIPGLIKSLTDPKFQDQINDYAKTLGGGQQPKDAVAMIAKEIAIFGDSYRGAKPDFLEAILKELKQEDVDAAPMLFHIGLVAVEIKVGLKASDAWPSYVAALENKHSLARIVATASIEKHGANARLDAVLPTLETLLKHQDRDIRIETVSLLQRIGSAAVPTLAKALTNPDESVRRGAAAALNQLGSGAKAAVAALRMALGSDDAELRRLAGETLTKIGKPAVPELASALSDKDETVRIAAAQILGKLGAEAKGAALELGKALGDSDRKVRSLAMKALYNLGPEAKDAVPDLITAVKSQDVDLRRAAADTLGRVGRDAKSAVPALTAVAKDEDIAARRNAIRALGNIGPDAKAALPTLTEAWKNSDPMLRITVEGALKKIDREAARKLGIE